MYLSCAESSNSFWKRVGGNSPNRGLDANPFEEYLSTALSSNYLFSFCIPCLFTPLPLVPVHLLLSNSSAARSSTQFTGLPVPSRYFHRPIFGNSPQSKHLMAFCCSLFFLSLPPSLPPSLPSSLYITGSEEQSILPTRCSGGLQVHLLQTRGSHWTYQLLSLHVLLSQRTLAT